MATNIQVVLQGDVVNVGKSGDIVRVKPGYARNFLIPHGHASMATRGNIQQVEHEKRGALARSAKFRQDAEAVAKRIDGTEITISRQAGEDGKLFGSVGTKDIAEALKAKSFEVDRKKIILHEPIKILGENDIQIRLGHDVSATIKVKVIQGQA